jgi:hypothetical protein
MANHLLAVRDGKLVGKNWPYNFVERTFQLKTRFNRKYDYQRAKCEGSKVIMAWFELVRNTVSKYGIVDHDLYNFDETGFQMVQPLDNRSPNEHKTDTVLSDLSHFPYLLRGTGPRKTVKARQS